MRDKGVYLNRQLLTQDRSALSRLTPCALCGGLHNRCALPVTPASCPLLALVRSLLIGQHYVGYCTYRGDGLSPPAARAGTALPHRRRQPGSFSIERTRLRTGSRRTWSGSCAGRGRCGRAKDGVRLPDRSRFSIQDSGQIQQGSNASQIKPTLLLPPKPSGSGHRRCWLPCSHTRLFLRAPCQGPALLTIDNVHCAYPVRSPSYNML